MRIKVHRVISGPDGTFGVLTVGDRPFCVTCEDPWNNNATGKSCVPNGRYDCVPHSGTKYKNVWRLENVPGRSAILIHQGNTIQNTEGCILVGRSFGTLQGLPAVLSSTDALNDLRALLPDRFTIEITGPAAMDRAR